MKIGAIMAVAILPEEKWEKEFEFFAENKFEYTELMCDYPRFAPQLVNSGQIKKIKELSQSYDVGLIMHAPFTHVNLSDDVKLFADFGIKEMQASIKLAERLEIDMMTVHGPYQSFDIDSILPKFIRNFVPILNDAKKANVMLCFENMPADCPQLPQKQEHYILAAKKLLEAGDFTNTLKMTFDIGHANTVCEPVKYYSDVVNALGKDFVQDMHIHDNHGKYDEHNAIGEGNIDFTGFLKLLNRLNYKGYFTLELDVLGESFDKRLAGIKAIRKMLTNI
ncbi:sugar phosphate isomerase/epimerase [Candidatus Woesearchaeota archaeon]|nr:sugar phosphate isomerase/epimerase [Candidatus Woesearchaeota archaeon]